MPYTGIVLAILAFHAAAFLILLSHWVVSAGLFPNATAKSAVAYGTRPIRATLLGIFTYGPLFVLLLNAGKIHNPVFKFIALFAGFGAMLVAFVGTAGLALRIGRNLCPAADVWQQALRGGVMLALVFITPLLGSLFLMHIGLASGFGVFLMTQPWKKAVRVAPLPNSAEAPALQPAPQAEVAEPVLS